MKKHYIIGILIWLVLVAIGYYLFLPALNLSSIGFWAFTCLQEVLLLIILSICHFGNISSLKKGKYVVRKDPLWMGIMLLFVPTCIVVILLINFVLSPIFNAKSYSERISVDETGDFSQDIAEVDFNALPLLDRDSSEKLGDRVMGQMSDLVSQFYVSEQYTQINYNNQIIRVTPLEYEDFFKWIANHGTGITGYITVNSVNGEATLTRLEQGMKYTQSAFFNENLSRKLRFTYPTQIFGEAKFEIDNDGKPYWVVPTISYTGVGLKEQVNGAVLLDPVTGESTLYTLEEIPTWVDNVYYANLVISQVDDWGSYKDGFLNSLFGQKNVTATTDGYNYLAMNDDIYLYTGITSVLADESNLGFILTNLRTGETTFYSAPGAEEYSAMASAEGQVQQMSYESTFPLLVNLGGKPTYVVSLKDAAGLVKMYGFVDVADYQKVVVTDASKGIEAAASNYLSSYSSEVSHDLLTTETIVVKKITSASINGTSYYYIVSDTNQKYKVSISVSDTLPFVSSGDTLNISYYDQGNSIQEITSIN